MSKYINRSHDQRGMPTSYTNRVDLDTALKERGMDGFYGKSKSAAEQKELHAFITKMTFEKGAEQTQRELTNGKLFNRKDMNKL